MRRELLVCRSARVQKWLFGVGVLIVASLPARPAETYRFYFFPVVGDRNEIPSAAGARAWEAEDLPLRFRMLENGNIPGEDGLDAVQWRKINRDSIAAWADVPTSTLEVLLEADTVLADQASDTDGINSIGFSSNEAFVDSWFSGFARSIRENGKVVECDIEISPFYFERSPVDDPAQAHRTIPDLYGIMTHEMGHCLGLAHTAMNPMWLARPEPADWKPGVLPEGIATLQPHPIMSYGSGFRSSGLTPDDIHAITLLYPAPGLHSVRGAIGGRVVFPNGDPVPLAYVQAVDYSGSGAAFGPGAFTDRRGQFMLEGMPPGPLHVWVRPLIVSRAHGGLELAMEAGSLDLTDRQRWFRVGAGEITLVPDIVVERGREAGR